MSPSEAKRGRRWYQFSLRALFVVTAAVAGLAFACVKITEPYRRQRETMDLIAILGGSYKTEAAATWVRCLANNSQNIVVVDLAASDDVATYLPELIHLPQLKTLVVSGHQFGDEQLDALRQITSLRGLVLDSTLVSAEGIATLKETLPDLVVYNSQRRARVELEKLGARLDRGSHDPPPFQEPVPPQWLRVDVSDLYFDTLPLALRNVRFDRDEWATARSVSADVNVLWLRNLKTVCGIELSNTGVSGAFLSDMPASPLLVHLNLDDATLTDSNLAHITRFPRLKSLGIRNTLISDKGLAHLVALAELEHLDVSNTSITDEGVKHLAGLPHLEFVFATNTRMGNSGLTIIAHMPSLYTLNVQGTRVTDEGIAHLLRQSQTLMKLSLAETPISDRSVPHLIKLGQLTDLDITETKISPSGMQRLRTALPKCDIRY